MKIFVIGETILDRYSFLKPLLNHKELPTPTTFCHEEKESLGGAANLVRNLYSLLDLKNNKTTNKLYFYTASLSEEKICLLHSDFNTYPIGGIPPDKNLILRKDKNASTNEMLIKERFYINNHGILRIDKNERLRYLNTTAMTAQLAEDMYYDQSFKFLVVSDYNKGLIGQLESTLAYANNALTFLDTNKLEDYHQNFDIVKINNNTALEYLQRKDKNWFEYLINFKEFIAEQLQCKILIVTRGEQGFAVYFAQEKRKIEFIVESKNIIVDAVGAGDVFLAGLISSLCNIYNEEYISKENLLSLNSIIAASSEAELAAYASTKFIGTLDTVDPKTLERLDENSSFDGSLLTKEDKINIKHFN